MMPDLPNVGWERDIESFREFFENPAFRTDGLKVYPTLVIRGTGLYELWKKGLYTNYSPDKVSCVCGDGVGEANRDEAGRSEGDSVGANCTSTNHGTTFSWQS